MSGRGNAEGAQVWRGMQLSAAAVSFGLHAAGVGLALWAAPSMAPPAARPQVVSVALIQSRPAPTAEVLPPIPEPPPPPPKPVPRPTPQKVQAPPEPQPLQPPPPQPLVRAAPSSAAVEVAKIAEETVLVEPSFQADYLRNPAPAYPRISRRLGEQGEVSLRVLVDPQGKPRRVELNASSGSERLDRAALDVVLRWSFVPARRGSRAVEAWVIVPIVFSLG